MPSPFAWDSPLWLGVTMGLVWRELLANVFLPVRRLADQWFKDFHESATHRRAMRELEAEAVKEDP